LEYQLVFPQGRVVVFQLSGSPPKGYSLIIPHTRLVNFYDLTGKRYHQLSDTTLVDPTQEERVNQLNYGGVKYTTF